MTGSRFAPTPKDEPFEGREVPKNPLSTGRLNLLMCRPFKPIVVSFDRLLTIKSVEDLELHRRPRLSPIFMLPSKGIAVMTPRSLPTTNVNITRICFDIDYGRCHKTYLRDFSPRQVETEMMR